jgi:hypothetical protein
MNDGKNEWHNWSVHVLRELKRLNDSYSSLDANFRTIQLEIAMLKVKSGIWGVIGGCIPILVIVIIKLLEVSK